MCVTDAVAYLVIVEFFVIVTILVEVSVGIEQCLDD